MFIGNGCVGLGAGQIWGCEVAKRLCTDGVWLNRGCGIDALMYWQTWGCVDRNNVLVLHLLSELLASSKTCLVYVGHVDIGVLQHIAF